MPGIFISYRRDDSQGFAGRLADDLTDILGPDLVFRDVEIPAGYDFTEVLSRAVAACDVLLVVIGRNWRAPSAHTGKSRLFDPADWVRAEIEAAFDQGKHVTPVLVGDANMCTAAELPESIAHLSKLQAFRMTDRRWDDDIQVLVKLLRKSVPKLKADSSKNQRRPSASPAQVLRELGDRVLDEVNHRGNSSRRNKYSHLRLRSKLLFGFGRYLKRFLTPVVLVAAIYIGLRLFGDAKILQMLDQLEARLLVGWDRLLDYVRNYR
ncbi:MAG: toll/interleukin-1 receptor domain-containing protein [Desulfobacterales bacterium]|jgi:hypothetical protein